MHTACKPLDAVSYYFLSKQQHHSSEMLFLPSLHAPWSVLGLLSPCLVCCAWFSPCLV